MLSDGVIEVNYLILVIALIAILSGLLIVLHFSRQKYENQLQSLQDEALLKLKALNERIELNHSLYEGQINTLNTENRKLEEEKKLIKESSEDKLKIIEKHASQINTNTIETYELKLSNLSKISFELFNIFKKTCINSFSNETIDISSIFFIISISLATN